MQVQAMSWTYERNDQFEMWTHPEDQRFLIGSTRGEAPRVYVLFFEHVMVGFGDDLEQLMLLGARMVASAARQTTVH
jgi:hypothetical protein